MLMESTSPPPLVVKGEIIITADPEVRTGSRDLWEVFLELPHVPCDVWGGYCSWQNPHLLPEEVWKVFFVQPGSGAQPYGPAACVRRLPRSASCLGFGVRVARYGCLHC